MPTEAQFEEAKVRFFAAADETQDLIRPTRQAMGPDVLTGGQLTTNLNRFVDTTGEQLDLVADSLRELARESAKRAEECRQAAAAQEAYLAASAAHRLDLADHQERATAFADDPTLPDPGDPPKGPKAPPAPPPYVEI